MKIDFDMLERLVDAGTPAKAIVAYLRAEDERRQPKRAKEKARNRAKRTQPKATNGNTEQQSPTSSQAAEKELFVRARQVLGKTAGGLVSALIKANGFNIAAARDVIETAASKGDPREYVVAGLKGAGHGTRNPTMAAFDDLISRTESGEIEGDPPMRDITPRGS